MISDDELGRLAALAEGATRGPWTCRHPRGGTRQPAPSPSMIGPLSPLGDFHSFPVAHCYGDNFADGDFLAAAREAVPALIEEVRRLRRLCPEGSL